MARHTKCAPAADIWDGVGGVDIAIGIVGVVAIIVAPIILLVAALSAAGITPASMAIAASALMFGCLFAINLLNHVRDYFFDHRLACLDGDRCALGRVVVCEANGDGDRSMNLILAPATDTTDETTYKTMFQPKELVYMDGGLAGLGFDLDPKAVREGHNPDHFGIDLPFFHCEIEGTWLDEYTTALLAYLWGLFALAVAALAAAAAILALGPVAWAIWIAVAILLILALGLIGLFGGDDADSAQPNPLGDATPSPTGPVITDVTGQSVSNGDSVAVRGRHVCDTGHNKPCWDELHPVLAVAKIRAEEYDKVSITHDDGGLYDQYCEALKAFVDRVGKVRSGLTVTAADGTPMLTHLEHPRIG